MAESSDAKYIGRSMKRVEDRRLVTGAGCFVDDFKRPGLPGSARASSPAR